MSNAYFKYIKYFFFIKLRTFYGSINVYSKISSKEDLEDSENIIYASPIWDIDSSPKYWKNDKNCRNNIRFIRKRRD